MQEPPDQPAHEGLDLRAAHRRHQPRARRVHQPVHRVRHAAGRVQGQQAQLFPPEEEAIGGGGDRGRARRERAGAGRRLPPHGRPRQRHAGAELLTCQDGPVRFCAQRRLERCRAGAARAAHALSPPGRQNLDERSAAGGRAEDRQRVRPVKSSQELGHLGTDLRKGVVRSSQAYRLHHLAHLLPLFRGGAVPIDGAGGLLGRKQRLGGRFVAIAAPRGVQVGFVTGRAALGLEGTGGRGVA
mmetsp:Transcript_862/g.2681  ORF Transcript_862/g.2681 Transcript_862/m.2681 type:complete len:242 (+) Transcript_862:4080-4805(+)